MTPRPKWQTINQATKLTPVIPALRRCSQEDYRFKAGLGYTARYCLRAKKEEK